jgi:hypothetical protein
MEGIRRESSLAVRECHDRETMRLNVLIYTAVIARKKWRS